MKLIIIDDDKEIITCLKANLNNYGFLVDVASNGKTGLKLISKNDYDLIILDLNLPDISGEQVSKTLRLNNQTMPILILSADQTIESKINLLNFGADDYLVKPFSLEELIARIQALLRRPSNIINQTVKVADLELNRQNKTLKKSNQNIYLTRKEFLLLEYFICNPKIVISRNEILEHVWDMKVNLFSKTIEMHILNLRKKIDSSNTESLIITVSGRGYKFRY